MNQAFAERFIRVAREVANVTFVSEKFRHVSIIVQNKSIESIGTNSSDKTHTLPGKYGYYGNVMHSELSAFRNLRYRSGNFILLNFRFNKHGELKLSKPCEHCHAWCVEFFDEIWYSTDEIMVKL